MVVCVVGASYSFVVAFRVRLGCLLRTWQPGGRWRRRSRAELARLSSLVGVKMTIFTRQGTIRAYLSRSLRRRTSCRPLAVLLKCETLRTLEWRLPRVRIR